jgi:hypothetical protein
MGVQGGIWSKMTVNFFSEAKNAFYANQCNPEKI